MEVEQQQNIPYYQTKEWRREYRKQYYNNNKENCLRIATNCYNRKTEEQKKELSRRRLENKHKNRQRCEICDREYNNINEHRQSQKHKNNEELRNKEGAE